MEKDTMTDPFLSNSLVDLRERLKAEHAAAVGALKSGLAHALAAGDILREAKRSLKHGQWLHWMASSGILESTAQRYMELAGSRSVIEAKSDTLTDLSVSGALTLLSVDSDELATKLAQKAVDTACEMLEIIYSDSAFDETTRLQEEAKAAFERIGPIIYEQRLPDALGQLFEDSCEQLIVAVHDHNAAISDYVAAGKKAKQLSDFLPISPIPETAKKIRDIAVALADEVEAAAVPMEGTR